MKYLCYSFEIYNCGNDKCVHASIHNHEFGCNNICHGSKCREVSKKELITLTINKLNK